MKRSDLKKLGMAIATAALLSAPAVPAFSYDVTPAALLQSVHQQVQAGNVTAARALLARLKLLGVTQIIINGQPITIERLEALVASSSAADIALLAQLVAAAQTTAVAYVVNNQVVAAIDSTQLDAFPTGSAG